MSDDPFDTDDWREFAKAAREELVPKLLDSAVVMSIIPERLTDIDVKIAVEIGFALLLDKPIIALVHPGAHVPNKLVLVAEEIIEMDLNDAGAAAKKIQAIVERLDLKGRRS